jgi:exonuclease VII small subunit
MLTNAEQAAQYRAKAEKLRAMANDLENEDLRLELWDVAAEYDKMADRAESRPPDLPAGMDQAPARGL